MSSKINIALMLFYIPLCCFGLDFTYSLKFSGYNAEVIIGSGRPVPAIPDDTKGHVTIPSTIDGYPVTEIADYAFVGCTNITSVTIPNTVKKIGHTVFHDCYNLKTIPNFPSEIREIPTSMFSWCHSLSSVVIPSHITKVGSSAFGNCFGLKSITFHENVTNANWSVDCCTNLEEVTIYAGRNGGDFDICGHDSFVGDVRLECKPKSIYINDLKYWCQIDKRSSGGFKEATLYLKGEPLTAKDLIIPEGTKKIGEFAFYGKAGIETVVIPKGVTSIETYAFNNCPDLVSVRIGEGVENIGTWCFGQCRQLEYVELPDSLERIASGAFAGAGIRKIVIPPNVTYIATNVFSGNIRSLFLYLPHSYSGSENIEGVLEVIRYAPEQNVKFVVPNDVDCPSDITVNFNKPYGVLPTAARIGYAFTGWQKSGKIVSSTNVVTAIDNHTLEATWEPNKYTISFHSNGGIGEMSPLSVSYDSATNLTANIFYQQGKVFSGWATNSVDRMVVYQDGAIVSNLMVEANSDITLYAVWSPLVVPTPTMDPSPESTFGTDSCVVSLSCELEGAVIYYSTNGITPRPISANEYKGPFEVFGDVSIKAVARFDGVNSEYLIGSIKKGPPQKPVIFPGNNSTFVGESCEVSIVCGTEGARIYYTTDGQDPEQSDRFKYTGPFLINSTTTIKAISANNEKSSEIVTVTISKWSLTLADGAGAPDLVFRTGEENKWEPIEDKTASTGYAARSGKIGCSSETWMETVVNGSGTLSFQWRVDCEDDDSGDCTWDRLVVFTNNVEAARIDGSTIWQNVTYNFNDSKEHVIRWTFIKDEYDEPDAPYSDFAWVSDVTWKPTVVIDPIPELSLTATAAEVALALEGTADAKLADNIKTATEYSAYRTWALGLTGVTPDAVKSSSFAWLSYALDTDTLITAMPKEGDVLINAFECAATDGTFEFAVKIDGVAIGDNALEANITKVFDVEGVEKLVSGEFGFSSDNVEVNAAAPKNGNVKFTVTAKIINNKKLDSFFFRVKMK